MIKLGFSDFWPGFSYVDNFISKSVDIPFLLSEEPDFLFYSCFGDEHKKYCNSTKIYYTGENIRPSLFECDRSISFDFNDQGEHNIRWPLYNLYYDPRFCPLVENRDRFCCMVVSNEKNKFRLNFFSELSRYKKVDSGGRALNNIGGPVKDKVEFLKCYKFCIAFENSSFPGYTTEKLIDAKKAGCIPIYWGNPLIYRDFDTNSFVNLHSFSSTKQCIEYIEYLDTNSTEFIKVLEKPLLKGNEYTKYSNIDIFKLWLNSVIEEKPRKTKHYILSACNKRVNSITTDIINRINIVKYE